MLLGEKNAESKEKRKFKARFVGLGNKLVDALGRLVKENLVHILPASPALIRLAIIWGLLTQCRPLRGDTPGAYLEAELSGPPTYLSVDAGSIPAHWKKANGSLRNPVRRVRRSLYGMGRGDVDWGRKAKGKVLGLGAIHVCDHGEGSLYMIEDTSKRRLPSTLIIIYVDDFIVVGPMQRTVYNALADKEHGGVGFGWSFSRLPRFRPAPCP